MQVFKPPHPPRYDGRTSIFLAGTIDNGQSLDWQAALTERLRDQEVLILNPRRDAWDASWEQSIHFPLFREQVEWEMAGLEQADIIFMYFAPGSKSPITLLELGLTAASQKLIVCCPDGFWRKGNVEVVCHRFGLPLLEDFEAALVALNKKILSLSVR
ncbi:MAG: nucleoside 2-deoxyribosyltransferase domain-containing protein [Bacteroidota bacterium]